MFCAMIRMIQSTSARHTKTYFTDGLTKSDYYLDGQELQGHYHGLLAKRMGLSSDVSKETFFTLCENINPMNGDPLTPRKKDNRTVGYDINFHCPKSVSVLHALAKDDHILKTFQDSVYTTMLDIEADSKTRVRMNGDMQDRNTGEFIWAEFVHQTSRPVDTHVPDPHLHSHCFVFNATWDGTEQQIKAGKFRDIKRDMPYYQARFHKRLSDNMITLGYNVRLTDSSFEIDGVPQDVIDMFSKRSNEIGQIAKDYQITNAKQLDGLGARTRSQKQKGLSMTDLKTAWKQQIHDLQTTTLESEGQHTVRFGPRKQASTLDPQHCVDHAILHCFERASVMAERRLLGTAYRHAIGNTGVSINDITTEFKADDSIIHIDHGDRMLCTTKDVLAEEKRMIELARHGQGKMLPLYQTVPALNLDGQQAAAVTHVLTTTNRVSIIRGAAGTGKTTLMREAVELIEQAGKSVTVVAPTAQASRGVLQQEGFAQADTVAKLLTDTKMQEGLTGQVLWVDEAGLLGTKDMAALLDLATRHNARLILGGDNRQHASVVRGDALRILNTVGGIETAEVSKIYRQKDVRYRDTVQDLSTGNVQAAFQKLDAMGALITVDPLHPNKPLVDDYIKALKKGKTALVISPTHKQGDEVTKAIRKKLKQAELLDKKEIMADRLSNVNLTEAERRDWRNYKVGHVIQFNQNMPGITRGSAWTVSNATHGKVQMKSDKGTIADLPLDKSNNFEVFKKTEIALAKGDKIQITKNGFDQTDKRLNNGMTLEVISVNKNGKINLRNKASKTNYQVDAKFGHLAHAHCLTSYSSQGKTVDNVFIAMPSGTFAATDAKQLYVSVSRGRDAAKIYTDDKEALLDHAAQLGDRQSALELVTRNQIRNHHVVIKNIPPE